MKNTKYFNPFISFQDKNKLKTRLIDELKELGLSDKDISNSVDRAWDELEKYRKDVKVEGKKALSKIREMGKKQLY